MFLRYNQYLLLYCNILQELEQSQKPSKGKKPKTPKASLKKTDGKKKFTVTVIDGAGPTGSMMAAGYSMFGKMEMETEDEHKHQKTVNVDGITAQQTYKKKTNDTQLLFAFQERFWSL